MKKTINRLLAGFRAERHERLATRIARELRDHTRNEQRRIHDARIRARGLRIYAAWATPRRKTNPPQGMSALIPGTTTTNRNIQLVRRTA
jgi:hypothetical protein